MIGYVAFSITCDKQYGKINDWQIYKTENFKNDCYIKGFQKEFTPRYWYSTIPYPSDKWQS